MELRCKPGDLAIIVKEEAGCEANIGRLVRVLERAQPYTDSDPLDQWWIAAANPSQPLLFLVRFQPGRQIEADCDPVKHSDSWLRPLPGSLVKAHDDAALEQPVQAYTSALTPRPEACSQ
jgi:hypothetical protein